MFTGECLLFLLIYYRIVTFSAPFYRFTLNLTPGTLAPGIQGYWGQFISTIDRDALGRWGCMNLALQKQKLMTVLFLG